MIILDVNVVLAIHLRGHAAHTAALRWMDGMLDSDAEFGVPITIWHSYLRLATNRAVCDPIVPIPEAFAYIHSMHAQPGYRLVGPGARHLQILNDLCDCANAMANLVPDAVLAAIAIENGAAVASFDRDFARFPNLRWVNPAERMQ